MENTTEARLRLKIESRLNDLLYESGEIDKNCRDRVNLELTRRLTALESCGIINNEATAAASDYTNSQKAR